MIGASLTQYKNRQMMNLSIWERVSKAASLARAKDWNWHKWLWTRVWLNNLCFIPTITPCSCQKKKKKKVEALGTSMESSPRCIFKWKKNNKVQNSIENMLLLKNNKMGELISASICMKKFGKIHSTLIAVVPWEWLTGNRVVGWHRRNRSLALYTVCIYLLFIFGR